MFFLIAATPAPDLERLMLKTEPDISLPRPKGRHLDVVAPDGSGYLVVLILEVFSVSQFPSMLT